jgi:DNA-3-methyladenine glycosylase II
MELHTFTTCICPITLSYDAAGLSSLRLHPAAQQVADGPSAGRPEWVLKLARQLTAHMAGEPQDFRAVPIDYGGTGDFARKVYQELRRVPAGTTVTYSQLAERTGRPRAARAVARAMATNRVPMVVPCHRVLRRGGGLGGFSGADGVKSKAQILWAEGTRVTIPATARLGGSIFEPYMWEIAMDHLSARDRRFDSLAAAAVGERLSSVFPDNPVGFLVKSVCYQQLAGAAARTIFDRVEAVVGDGITATGILSAGADNLRGAGLSASKTATIIGLAEAVEQGTLVPGDLAASTREQLIGRLTAYRGIGPWTAEMFAIFHLGMPDIFSPSDLGIRKALARHRSASSLPSVEEAKLIGSRWRPFRTVATWHLWRSLDVVTM